jgi:general secretion pathway protein J
LWTLQPRKPAVKPATTTRLPGRSWVPGQQTGFTLIEVLLAVTISSIVLVAIHLLFYGAIQLRNKSAEVIEQGIPLQQALAIIKRDLENVVLPGERLLGELQTTMTSTSSNLLTSLNEPGNALPGQSSPALFTASGLLSEQVPWAEVQRVAYYLAPPTNNSLGKDLIRSVTRNLLPVFPEEPVTRSILSGVQSITFWFYDGLQWREYWDSTIETNKLPYGIKVELQLVSAPTERLRREPIELVVPILVQAGTNTTSTGEEEAL